MKKDSYVLETFDVPLYPLRFGVVFTNKDDFYVEDIFPNKRDWNQIVFGRTSLVQEEFEEALFNFNSIDSKQKALKVFMNTFYGEAGNKRSPLYLLQIAGGITMAGQRNIKSAQKYVENLDCKVYYGDIEFFPYFFSSINAIHLSCQTNIHEHEIGSAILCFFYGFFSCIENIQNIVVQAS